MLVFQIIFLLGVTIIGALITLPLAFRGVARIKKGKKVEGGLLCLPTLFFASLPLQWLGAIGLGCLWYTSPSNVFASVFARKVLKEVRETKAYHSYWCDAGCVYMTFKGDRMTFDQLVRMRAQLGETRKDQPDPQDEALRKEYRVSGAPAWWNVAGTMEKIILPGRKEFASETKEMYWWPDGLIAYKYEGVD